MRSNKFYSFLFTILLPFIVWGTIIAIYYFLGFKIVFKSIFNFLLGLLYAFASFLCYHYYKKNLFYEAHKERYLSKIEFNNSEQYKIEQDRRDKFWEEYANVPNEYHSAARGSYLIQGIIAVILSIEFLLGWA